MITKYEIAAIAALNDLEGWQKLTAYKQREFFGFAALGRKNVNFDCRGQGVVRVSVSKCFGTDGYTRSFSFAQFAEICNKREKIEL